MKRLSLCGLQGFLGTCASAALLLGIVGCQSKAPANYGGVMSTRGAVPPPLAASEAVKARPVVPEAPLPPTSEPLRPAPTAPTVAPQPQESGNLPPSAPTAPAGISTIHTVGKGETLSQIARANGTTVSAILAANPQLTSPNRLRLGQEIRIPAAVGNAPVAAPETPAATSAVAPTAPEASFPMPPAPPVKTSPISEGAPEGAPVRKGAKGGKAGKTATATTGATTKVTAATQPRKGRNPIPASGIYTTVANDSLWGISRRYGVTMEDLRSWNNLTSDRLRPGQVLKLRADAVIPPKGTAPARRNGAAASPKKEDAKGTTPAIKPEKTEPAPAKTEPAAAIPANVVTTPYFVSSGDTLERIALACHTTVAEVLRYNPQIKSDADLKPDTRLNIPATGIP